jgi:hypothetical protein
MSEYSNENRGALWPNDRMREGKQDPQYTGSLNAVCPCCGEASEFRLKGWKKKDGAKQGAPSLSIAIDPKEANTASRDAYSSKAETKRDKHAETVANDPPDFDDRLPF